MTASLITRLEEAAEAQPLLLTLPPQPTALARLLREAADALERQAAMLAASPQGEGSSADADQDALIERTYCECRALHRILAEPDWITHDGRPNPVPGKRAFYRYFALGDQSDPLETTQALPSDLQDWEWPGHTAGAYDDIVAYRVTEGVKP